MLSLRKKIILFCFLPLILLIAVSIVYSAMVTASLTVGEELIFCKFKHTFLLYCPGCGGSRSLIALLSLDFVKSFILFPALPVTVLIMIDFYVRATVSFIKNDAKYLKGFRTWLLIIIPTLIILNFFVRNIFLLNGIDLIGDFIK